MKVIAQPKPASTVILLRPSVDGGFEVFMTRRPAGMKFLGGMYVFPGGTVRKEDCAEGVLNRCHGLPKKEAQIILGGQLKPDLALAHWVAAIRELFEEVGVLLCLTESGKPVEMKTKAQKEWIDEKRQALVKGHIDFLKFLESEKLYCDTTRLSYFSHWRTTEEFPIRFDTRFFLALLPQDQIPLSTSQEVAESLWTTPEHALELCHRGSLPMIFPTFASLRTLANFDTLENLVAEYRKATP